jgi:hypothetical protein
MTVGVAPVPKQTRLRTKLLKCEPVAYQSEATSTLVATLLQREKETRQRSGHYPDARKLTP